jgi:hypothetical protein
VVDELTELLLLLAHAAEHLSVDEVRTVAATATATAL